MSLLLRRQKASEAVKKWSSLLYPTSFITRSEQSWFFVDWNNSLYNYLLMYSSCGIIDNSKWQWQLFLAMEIAIVSGNGNSNC